MIWSAVTMGYEERGKKKRQGEIRPGVTIQGQLIWSGCESIFLQEVNIGQAVSL